MCSELDQVRGARDRWRFSVGCARASVLIRLRVAFSSRERGGGGLRAVVLTGIPVLAGLAGYGLIHYPQLRSDPHAWASMAGFLALALAYAALALALSRGTTRSAVAARRYGLAGGVVAGGAWFLALSPPAALKAWVLIPLVVALLAPACAAAMAARSAGAADAVTRAALWSGIVGGLILAVAWVTTAYLHDGRPYDAGLVQDFHRSGAPDLTSYAVSGELATSLGLLLLLPIFALAFGALASIQRRSVSRSDA
jgi:hypothetical protein